MASILELSPSNSRLTQNDDVDTESDDVDSEDDDVSDAGSAMDNGFTNDTEDDDDDDALADIEAA
jgi:hypothetical protein